MSAEAELERLRAEVENGPASKVSQPTMTVRWRLRSQRRWLRLRSPYMWTREGDWK